MGYTKTRGVKTAMRKVLNFGSLNLDYVYQVPHFVQPGETLHAAQQQVHCGGKGLNQSIALSRAGAEVYHAGCVGEGGERLVQELRKNGVDTKHIAKVPAPQGNAVIQVDANAENCILLFGGSNRMITSRQIETVLADFAAGDWLVLQNEINGMEEILEKAFAKGMQIALNPSPFDADAQRLDYKKVTWLLVNRIEAEQITGQTQPQQVWETLHAAYPNLNLVLTQGSKGADCFTAQSHTHRDAFRVEAVDTTAAGDTFTGYFLDSLLRGQDPAQCLERASCASAIAVTRSGAADSIPAAEEVERWLAQFRAARDK